MVQLRDYQILCLQSIMASAKRGMRRQLVVLPTGTGKTVIFSQLPKMIKNRAAGKRMLAVAHREELLDQGAGQLETWNPDLRIDVEQAKRKASPHADVIVASIQTLSASPKRLELLGPESIGLLVIDEAHHATARTYVKLMSRFGLAPDIEGLEFPSLESKSIKRETANAFRGFKPQPGSPYLIGFTATPHRGDAIGLEYVIDEITFSRTIEEMMRAEWLCKIRGKRIQSWSIIGEILKGIKQSHGDFAVGQLEDAVNIKVRNQLAVDSYLQYAPGRRTLVFCVGVSHAEAMCAAFKEANVNAEYVIGATPKDLRQDTIAKYRAGEIDVLVNCMVLTEGFDAPETNCIIMARPTQSSSLYTQMVGRGTRIAPGKDDLLVLDIVDAGRVGVSSLNSLFGLPPEVEVDEETDMLEAIDEMEEIFSECPDVDIDDLLNAKSMKEAMMMARDVNPLREADMPDHLEAAYTWVKTQYGYALSVEGAIVGVVINALGQGTVKVKERGQASLFLSFEQTEQSAIDFAEEYVREAYPGAMMLITKGAAWRQAAEGQPATEKQAALIERMKIKTPENPTKAMATVLISRAMARRAMAG